MKTHIHFQESKYDWTTHVRNPEVLIDKEHLLLSHTIFKEMRIMTAESHMYYKKPTFDIRKMLYMLRT